VFSRLRASENLVAGKASAHTLNCDEDLADLICSDGCGADDFHVFAIDWDLDSISFYVDHDLYVRHTRADLKPGWKWVFDKPFFLILNLAVGGDWPDNPDTPQSCSLKLCWSTTCTYFRKLSLRRKSSPILESLVEGQLFTLS
jgi:beta-glucanase (GH16 family)